MRRGALTLVTFLSAAAIADADRVTNVLHAVTTVSTRADEYRRVGFEYGGWTSGWGDPYRTWLKYSVPGLPGHTLVSAALDIHPYSQNEYWYPGIDIDYVADDSWGDTTITNAWPLGGLSPIVNRYFQNGTPGEYIMPRISSDITAWLQESGEGLGQVLSVRLSRNDASGPRGWTVDGYSVSQGAEYTTLTLVTDGPPLVTVTNVFEAIACVSTRSDEFSYVGLEFGGWTSGWGSPWYTWLKFSVPSIPGHTILSALVDVHPYSQNEYWYPGINIDYVADDSWGDTTITNDWPLGGLSAVQNRVFKNGTPGQYLMPRVSSDITTWVVQPDEGLDHLLSMRLSRNETVGNRGWSVDAVALGAGAEHTTLTLVSVGPPIQTVTNVYLPSVRVSTRQDNFRVDDKEFGGWTSGWGDPYHTWLKFSIPATNDQAILSAMLNVHPYSQNEHYYPGIDLDYVTNDTWTSGTITYDWPVGGLSPVRNRYNVNGPASQYVMPLVSSDITEWLLQPAEGLGQALSIRLSRYESAGTRGWSVTPSAVALGAEWTSLTLITMTGAPPPPPPARIPTLMILK